MVRGRMIAHIVSAATCAGAMKQLLLFCSLLFCLPALTAHLHGADSTPRGASSLMYDETRLRNTEIVPALVLRGGDGDYSPKYLESGPTMVAPMSHLDGIAARCEEFDAATLRPAQLPALKIPMPKHRRGGSDTAVVFAGKQEHETVTCKAHEDSACDESLMEDDNTDNEPGTSVSADYDAAGTVADERTSKRKRKQLRVGDSMNNRLTITSVLGEGAFGTVYMAKDQRSGESVAVKVQRAGKRHWQVAQDEIRLLKAVAAGKKRSWGFSRGSSEARGSSEVVKLLASFVVPSADGPQVCLAQELLGPSLLDVIVDSGYAGIALPKVRAIMRDVLSGLDYLHAQCGIIHTDVKPENVLLKLPPGAGHAWWLDAREAGGEGKLRKGWSTKAEWDARGLGAKLVDLGNSCFEGRPFTDDIQTVEYRCPEVVLGAGYDRSADLWSAACLAFELITGEYLFDPQEGVGPDGRVQYGKDEDLLALHQELLGPMPRHLAVRGRLAPLLVDEHGRLRHISSLKFWSLHDVLVEKYGMPERDAAGIAEFLLPMLKLDPAQRPSAAQMLQHPWLHS